MFPLTARGLIVTASPYAGKMPARVKMFDTGLNERLGAAKQHMNFAIECLGAHIPPGARILDFGCGIGTSVGALLADGYEPYGVDVLEYWDRDFDKYGSPRTNRRPKLPAA